MKTGWDKGVMKMSLGERAILHITSDFGYGARGAGNDIPPNANLDFDVEVSSVAQMGGYHVIPAFFSL